MGFTLLDKTRVGLQGLLKNLSNRVKGRGTKKVFIFSTPALPHRRGGGYWRDLKYSLLIFNIHIIMD